MTNDTGGRPVENDRDIIEFRFSPRARWESVPAAYSASAAFVLYANYDLRINGKVHPRELR